MMSIRMATFPADEPAVLAIWREFIASSPVDLGFQSNGAEFAALPGKYARPEGGVLLAEQAGAILGCVALREVGSGICEMKRLYVRPSARGMGLGQALVERVITEARLAGYCEIRLDVLPHSAAARGLYARYGFLGAEPVSFNPTPGTSFLGLHL